MSDWAKAAAVWAKAAVYIVFFLLCFAYCTRQEIKQIITESDQRQKAGSK
jgi:hypothetical protein